MRFNRYILAFMAVGIFMPIASQARSLQLPSNTFGVTEQIYHELKNSHCYYEQAPSTAVPIDSGIKCDPILANYAGYIIMRVEHHGELYQVNTADGRPAVYRYLPDGFYTFDGKYQWVSGNQRVRVKKNNAYDRILAVAQSTPSAVQPLSNAQFESFFESCEYYGEGDAKIDFSYQQCVSRVVAAQALQQRLAGRVALLVDRAGALAYIPESTNGANALIIGDLTDDQLFQLIQQEAIAVNKKTLRHILINNDWR